MDVKLDTHRTLVINSFNFGITTFTPIAHDEVLNFGRAVYQLTMDQKSPKEINEALKGLGYVVMKVSEKEQKWRT